MSNNKQSSRLYKIQLKRQIKFQRFLARNIDFISLGLQFRSNSSLRLETDLPLTIQRNLFQFCCKNFRLPLVEESSDSFHLVLAPRGCFERERRRVHKSANLIPIHAHRGARPENKDSGTLHMRYHACS